MTRIVIETKALKLNGSAGRSLLLLVTNIVLLSLGTLMVASGSIMLAIFLLHLLSFSTSLFLAAPVLLMLSGAVTVFVAVFGLALFRRKKEVSGAFAVYAGTLAVAFVLGLAASATAFVLRDSIAAHFYKTNVRTELANYATDPDIRARWDRLQIEYSCCGGYHSGTGYTDWEGLNVDPLPYDAEEFLRSSVIARISTLRRSESPAAAAARLVPTLTQVPDSCCLRRYPGCGKDAFSDEHIIQTNNGLRDSSISEKIHVNGCMDVIKAVLFKHVLPLLLLCALVALIVAMVELLLLLCSACFADHIRRVRLGGGPLRDKERIINLASGTTDDLDDDDDDDLQDDDEEDVVSEREISGYLEEKNMDYSLESGLDGGSPPPGGRIALVSGGGGVIGLGRHSILGMVHPAGLGDHPAVGVIRLGASSEMLGEHDNDDGQSSSVTYSSGGGGGEVKVRHQLPVLEGSPSLLKKNKHFFRQQDSVAAALYPGHHVRNGSEVVFLDHHHHQNQRHLPIFKQSLDYEDNYDDDDDDEDASTFVINDMLPSSAAAAAAAANLNNGSNRDPPDKDHFRLRELRHQQVEGHDEDEEGPRGRKGRQSAKQSKSERIQSLVGQLLHRVGVSSSLGRRAGGSSGSQQQQEDNNDSLHSYEVGRKEALREGALDREQTLMNVLKSVRHKSREDLLDGQVTGGAKSGFSSLFGIRTKSRENVTSSDGPQIDHLKGDQQQDYKTGAADDGDDGVRKLPTVDKAIDQSRKYRAMENLTELPSRRKRSLERLRKIKNEMFGGGGSGGSNGYKKHSVQSHKDEAVVDVEEAVAEKVVAKVGEAGDKTTTTAPVDVGTGEATPPLNFELSKATDIDDDDDEGHEGPKDEPKDDVGPEPEDDLHQQELEIYVVDPEHSKDKEAPGQDEVDGVVVEDNADDRETSVRVPPSTTATATTAGTLRNSRRSDQRRLSLTANPKLNTIHEPRSTNVDQGDEDQADDDRGGPGFGPPGGLQSGRRRRWEDQPYSDRFSRSRDDDPDTAAGPEPDGAAIYGGSLGTGSTGRGDGGSGSSSSYFYHTLSSSSKKRSVSLMTVDKEDTGGDHDDRRRQQTFQTDQGTYYGDEEESQGKEDMWTTSEAGGIGSRRRSGLSTTKSHDHLLFWGDRPHHLHHQHQHQDGHGGGAGGYQGQVPRPSRNNDDQYHFKRPSMTTEFVGDQIVTTISSNHHNHPQAHHLHNHHPTNLKPHSREIGGHITRISVTERMAANPGDQEQQQPVGRSSSQATARHGSRSRKVSSSSNHKPDKNSKKISKKKKVPEQIESQKGSRPPNRDKKHKKSPRKGKKGQDDLSDSDSKVRKAKSQGQGWSDSQSQTDSASDSSSGSDDDDDSSSSSSSSSETSASSRSQSSTSSSTSSSSSSASSSSASSSSSEASETASKTKGSKVHKKRVNQKAAKATKRKSSQSGTKGDKELSSTTKKKAKDQKSTKKKGSDDSRKASSSAARGSAGKKSTATTEKTPPKTKSKKNKVKDGDLAAAEDGGTSSRKSKKSHQLRNNSEELHEEDGEAIEGGAASQVEGLPGNSIQDLLGNLKLTEQQQKQLESTLQMQQQASRRPGGPGAVPPDKVYENIDLIRLPSMSPSSSQGESSFNVHYVHPVIAAEIQRQHQRHQQQQQQQLILKKTSSTIMDPRPAGSVAAASSYYTAASTTLAPVPSRRTYEILMPASSGTTAAGPERKTTSPVLSSGGSRTASRFGTEPRKRTVSQASGTSADRLAAISRSKSAERISVRTKRYTEQLRSMSPPNIEGQPHHHHHHHHPHVHHHQAQRAAGHPSKPTRSISVAGSAPGQVDHLLEPGRVSYGAWQALKAELEAGSSSATAPDQETYLYRDKDLEAEGDRAAQRADASEGPARFPSSTASAVIKRGDTIFDLMASNSAPEAFIQSSSAEGQIKDKKVSFVKAVKPEGHTFSGSGPSSLSEGQRSEGSYKSTFL